ncbi:hypothetical protein EP073_12795 [Geovibrio thiophilus]|uniref:Uncharacterized protein n=1 Tax=Geovibrio thiophilus TaxID=139438 RepID=A0A410K1D2_9BACT|nr:hypothetical protein [Geovibrio thiophilus]QAR34250.1 hypothetical protein EP073_12795 [Geovibrio thiophilus]
MIKNSRLYNIENGRADFPASTEQTGSFNLFLDDSMFFYLSMDLPSSNRKKARGFISNYLSTLFPEYMTENFGFVLHGGSALIYLPAQEFASFVKENLSLLKKASKITTPFIEMFVREASFDYTDGSKCYSVSGGEIHQLFDEPDDACTAERILNKVIPPKMSINIKGVEKESFIPSSFKLPAIVLAACYLVFIGGEYLRLKGYASALKLRENKLQELYTLAGVNGTGDPYGTLLFKARGGKETTQGVSILTVFETMSKAADKNKIKLEDLTVRDTTINCTGTAADFQAVEEFKQKLQEAGAQRANIEDTDKQGEIIKFSVRFSL